MLAFGHAGWISLDCRRRGQEAGLRRIGAFALGPLFLWFYFLREHGLRGLPLVGLSLGAYGYVTGVSL